jgi:hypothetical protein
VLRSTFLRRRRLAVVLIVVLLFSQFATVAYACPNSAKQEHGSNAAMADCEGASGAARMDPEHPLLCQASCEDTAQSSGTSATADSVQASALLYVLPPAAARDQDHGLPADVLPSLGEPPPGWPPLYLLNRVLRN